MDRSLSPTSHLVLGMVAVFGPMTSYELEQRVAATVGHFWFFPHSQLYAEPRRLVGDGLLEVHVESGGRRRRTYVLTGSGRAALREWLAEPELGRAQIRDPGLLKLFFGSLATPGDILHLARDRASVHRKRASEFAARRRELEGGAEPHILVTLELGLRLETAVAEFWEDVERRPPERK